MVEAIAMHYVHIYYGREALPALAERKGAINAFEGHLDDHPFPEEEVGVRG
jgi:hypothetical protein